MSNSSSELLCQVTSPVASPRDDGPPESPPGLPVTIIERKSGWKFVDVAELWRYRELLFFLVWRDVKVRYKQTALGATWAVLQPVATMLVFTLFLARVTASSGGIAYPLFVFAGLLPWIFFANAIGSSGQSVVGNQNLVTKVYFPRLIIPMSAVGAALVDFGVAFGMLVVLMFCYGVVPGRQVLLVPFIVLLLLIAAVGMGALLAALTVAYRDFRHMIPFAIQLWMFATPTIYLQGDDLLGDRARALLPLNPAYGLIDAFRQAMLDGPLDVYSLAVSGAVSVGLLFLGCLYYRRVERSFADII